MATGDGTKKGNLRARSPEELLDIEVAAAFAQLRGAKGEVPAKPFYKIAEGEQHPTRVMARRIREARAARVAREEIARAVLAPLRRYIERKYRNPGTTPTGDFDRVA